MKNVRNRIDLKFLSNRKNYLKWTSKPSYISHNIYNNSLVPIHKNKVTLTLNKPAYSGIFMYELRYDYIKKNK